MTVSKRGNKFQAYVTLDGQRYRKSFDTKIDAHIWEEKVREAVTVGKPLPILSSKLPSTQGWTLKDAGDRTYALHWRDSRSEEKMVFNMNRALKFFGTKRPVRDITTEQVDEYILHLKNRNLSNATINRHLAALSKILTVSLEYDQIEKKPKFRRLQETKWRLRWLTQDEVKRLLQTCEDLGYDDIYDAIAVSVDTGIRAGELQQLRTDSVRDGGLLVDGKNHDWRSIPLTKRAAVILARRASASHCLGSNPQFLFPRGAWWRSGWERVRGLSGLGEDVVWHTLRHTFASRLVQKGAPLQVVQGLMGHRTIQTTLRYAKINPTNTADAIASLES